MSDKLTWEKALKGGKNTSLRELNRMLKSYGFIPGENRGDWIHPDHPDLKFSMDPSDEKEIDTRALKQAGSKCQLVEERAAKTGVQVLPKWLKLDPGFSGEMRGNKLRVWYSDFPEIQLRLNSHESKQVMMAAYNQQMAIFQDRLTEYVRLRRELIDNYGFEFINEDGELIIRHEDYEIEEDFPFNYNSDLFLALKLIEEQAAIKCLEWAEKFEGINREGFTTTKHPAENGNTKVEVSSPHIKEPFEIILRGKLERITREDFDKIEAAVIESRKAKAKINKEKISQHLAEAEAAGQITIGLATPIRPNISLPDEQKASLIIDASTLTRLAAPRGNGRTWMDIVPFIAAVSTVDMVYFTGTVADIESRGRIMKNGKGGILRPLQIFPKMIDPDNPRSLAPLQANKLLMAAGRWRLDDKLREGFLIPGSDRKLLIHENILDRQYMDGMLNIFYDPAIKNKAEAYEELRNHLGNHIGERSMLITAKNVWNKGPVFLISDDYDFLRHREQVIVDDKYYVGEATLLGLIGAMIDAYGDELKTMLEIEGELSLSRIINDIIVFKKALDPSYPDTYPEWYPNCTPGSIITESGLVAGETLSSIISRGAAIERGEQPVFLKPLKPLRPKYNSHAPTNLATPAAEVTEPASAVEVVPEPPVITKGPELKISIPGHVPIGSNTSAIFQPPVKGRYPVKRSLFRDESDPALTFLRLPEILPANVIHTMTDVPAPSEGNIESPIVKSLGHLIGERCKEREMTENELALAVMALIEGPVITDDTIFRWQTNQELPDEHSFKALVTILIEQNKHITNKSTATREFEAAYKASKKIMAAEAHGQVDNTKLGRADKFAFINTLRKYRKKAELTDDVEFAKIVRDKLTMPVEKEVGRIDRALMYRVENNLQTPTFDLLRVIVRALDQKKELAPKDKQEIFDTYKTAVIGRKELFADLPVAQIRIRLRSYLAVGGKDLPNKEITKRSGVRDQDLLRLFGAKASASSLGPTRMKDCMDRLTTLVREINGSQKGEEFHSLFARMIELAHAPARA